MSLETVLTISVLSNRFHSKNCVFVLNPENTKPMNNYALVAKYFLASLFILTSISLVGNAETVETEAHGVCFVSTEKDDFTDKTSYHVIACEGRSSSDSYGDYNFAAACFDTNMVVVTFKAGIQFHLEDYIQVKYRFGKDKAEITSWEWSSGSSAVNRFRGTHDAVVDLLGKAKKGEKLIFQVGDNKGAIEFTGEEGKAVAQYLKRCSGLL